MHDIYCLFLVARIAPRKKAASPSGGERAGADSSGAGPKLPGAADGAVPGLRSHGPAVSTSLTGRTMLYVDMLFFFTCCSTQYKYIACSRHEYTNAWVYYLISFFKNLYQKVRIMLTLWQLQSKCTSSFQMTLIIIYALLCFFFYSKPLPSLVHASSKAGRTGLKGNPKPPSASAGRPRPPERSVTAYKRATPTRVRRKVVIHCSWGDSENEKELFSHWCI